MAKKIEDPPDDVVKDHDKSETSYQRALREAWVMEQVALGYSHREIARKVNLSQPRVSAIVRGFRESGVELRLSKPPQQLVEEHLTAQFRSIENHLGLASAAAEAGDMRLAFSHVAQSDAVRKDAMKSLVSLGMVPRWMGHLRQIIDFQGIAREMATRLRLVAAGEMPIEFATEYFDALTRLGNPDGPPVGPAGLPEVDTHHDAEGTVEP